MVNYIWQKKQDLVADLKEKASVLRTKAKEAKTASSRANYNGQAFGFEQSAYLLEHSFFKQVSDIAYAELPK